MKRLIEDPSNTGILVMLALAAVAAILALTVVPKSASGNPELPAEDAVTVLDHSTIEHEVETIEAYIKKFLLTWYSPGQGKRWKEAPQMARWIVEESHKVGADPYAVAVIIRFESSYRVRPGSGINCGLKKCVGEKGLGQLHGLAARYAKKHGCDLDTPRGQLCGTALWWNFAMKKCGSEERALRAYQTGDCRVKTAGSIRRLSQLQKLRSQSESTLLTAL